jgi:hypothetical protein
MVVVVVIADYNNCFRVTRHLGRSRQQAPPALFCQGMVVEAHYPGKLPGPIFVLP